MNKKIVFVIFVLLGLTIVYGVDRSDYLQHVETRADLDSAYTHYKICNPTMVDYLVDSAERFKVDFVEAKNTLSSYRFSKLVDVPYEVTVNEFGTCKYPYEITVCDDEPFNQSCRVEKGETEYRCKTGSHLETRYRKEWQEFNPLGEGFKAGECYDIRVEARYPFDLFGVAIDNIISYATYRFDEFVWMNASFFNETFDNDTYINKTASYGYRIAGGALSGNSSGGTLFLDNFNGTTLNPYNWWYDTFGDNISQNDNLTFPTGGTGWGQDAYIINRNFSSIDSTSFTFRFRYNTLTYNKRLMACLINSSEHWDEIMNENGDLYDLDWCIYYPLSHEVQIYEDGYQVDTTSIGPLLQNIDSDVRMNVSAGYIHYFFKNASSNFWQGVYNSTQPVDGDVGFFFTSLYNPPHDFFTVDDMQVTAAESFSNYTAVSTRLNSSTLVSSATLTYYGSIPAETTFSCKMRVGDGTWHDATNHSPVTFSESGYGLIYNCTCVTDDDSKTCTISELTIDVEEVTEAPVINTISAEPSPQGLGENVIIEANITSSSIDTVLVEVTPPGESPKNFTMQNISAEMWQYSFTDYANGTYFYTVRVNDSYGLTDNSSGSFEMYANISVNIVSSESSYSGNEMVYITDPASSYWVTATQQEFNNGTLNQTYYNDTVGGVVLNATYDSGTYESAVFAAGAPASWNNISWGEELPYQQELPNNKGSDSGADMSGNVLLMHLNEASGTIADSSGEGNDGTAYGVTYGADGKFNGALGFDGVDDYVDVGNPVSLQLNDPFTIGAWVKKLSSVSASQYKTIVAHGTGGWVLGINDDKLFVSQSGQPVYVSGATTLSNNQWYHVIAVRSGTNTTIYVNGKEDGTSSSSPTFTFSNPVTIAYDTPWSGSYLNAVIDEVAIYNRTLSATEILDIYKRGVLDLNFQARSCNDTVCSGESFIGPDGTSSTYYNESSGENLNAVNNTYFQFKAYLSTEDTAVTPELYNVSVGYESVPVTESKLINQEDVLNTSIYLLMKVQYFDGSWIEESARYYNTTPIRVLPGVANQLKLDQYWQPWNTHDRLNPYGTYRVFAAATDENNVTITNIDGSLAEAYYNFTIVNTAPTAPTLLNPADGLEFGVLPEFNWTAATDIDNDTIYYVIQIDNNNDFSSPEYTNNTLPSNKDTTVTLDVSLDDTYYWRVLATDNTANSSWSATWNFTYALWNITFNVTSYETGLGLNNVNISFCNYTSFNQSGDTTNPYGPYEFPPGTWKCTFKKLGFFDKTQTFDADSDMQRDVVMSFIGALTLEEHTWLEALYNCIILEDCDLWNILLEINQSATNVWNMFKQTDESVVASEVITNKIVSSTTNLTIDYSINIPNKAGYAVGTYLPVRIGYWFLNESNNTCYNQGTQPVGVTEPYCNPLMVQTIGPMGGSVDFTVELKPELPAGDYTIVRAIEIDPDNVWYRYGQEIIGMFSVSEDTASSGISLETIKEINPAIQQQVQQASEGTSSVEEEKIEQEPEQAKKETEEEPQLEQKTPTKEVSRATDRAVTKIPKPNIILGIVATLIILTLCAFSIEFMVRRK